jgi:drug/metabolite transporter (DMT)-like permease
MHQRLTPATAALLTLAPLLWAGNAVVGRLMAGHVPPVTLNFFRWLVAAVLLLPWTLWLLRTDSPLWPKWRRFTVLGLLGVGSYNALQYLALETSTPVNVTLVAASTPVWMLAIGALFYGQGITRRQVAGAVLSLAGVAVVLCRGDWHQLLQVRFVPGDLFILLAAMGWAWYSWLLLRPGDPQQIRGDWAAFLMAQVVFGLGWSGLFAAGEWVAAPQAIDWSLAVFAAVLYVAVGPSIIAYRCFGLGVQRVGPSIAGFFGNLAPLFAAVMSAGFLGEPPRPFHLAAFVLIVGGIWVSRK